MKILNFKKSIIIPISVGIIEFIFRGFLYNRLKVHSVSYAILLSGILWGIPHAVLPSLINNSNIYGLISLMFDEIGSKVLVGWYFIYLQEKSKTLWVPILIHAILDYTVGGIGVVTAVVMYIYFFKISKSREVLIPNISVF